MQCIAQENILSQIQVQKHITSTELINFNESTEGDKNRSGNESNRKCPISANNISIAIPNIKLPQPKSTLIEFSSLSFFY